MCTHNKSVKHVHTICELSCENQPCERKKSPIYFVLTLS